MGSTYGLGADIWVPDLGFEAHDRRSEWILAWNLDVYHECAALVWCVWWAVELALEMCEVIAVSCGLNNDLGVLVVLDIGNLFGDAPGPVGRGHCGVLGSWGECW
jgi:hypothetical protein